MLTIRLFRIGRKNQPAFKIVVTDSRRSSTRGRFVEEVGIYNPVSKQRNIKGDRVKYWISVGAQPSATVHNMLVTDKIIEGSKIAKHKIVPAKAPAENPPQAGPPQSSEAGLGGEPENKPADVSSEALAKEEEPKPAEEAEKQP